MTGFATKADKGTVAGWERAKGRIAIASVNEHGLTGTIDLQFSDGAQQGEFSAAMCPQTAMCR